MRRVLLPVLVALLLLVPLPGPAHAVGATAIASGLDFPAAMTVAPGGLIFYGERFTGEIRTRNRNTGVDKSFFTLSDIATAGEQGLLGLAVHPLYPSTPFVYAYATRFVDGVAQNQVIRIRAANGVGTGMAVLFDLRAGVIHNGGAMVFAPDRRLFIVTGEIGNPANSQITTNLLGKVLRINGGGGPAPGNVLGNRVFSYGHRNMFGAAMDPQRGLVWVTENGPSCNDEINRPVNGGNFAWGPAQSCGLTPDAEDTNRDGPAPRRFPAFLINPVIAPTGAVFCAGCGLGSATEGTLLFGAWNDGGIRRLTLNGTRTAVTASTLLYDHPSGILSMARAPNGDILFTDSDQIYQLTP